MMQLPQPCKDVLRDKSVFRHALEPGPAAAGGLQLLQFPQAFLQVHPEVIGIEKEAELLFALRFTVCLHHPGRFLQQCRFQLLVFGKVRPECIRGEVFPRFEHCLDFRIGIGDVCGNAVGPECGKNSIGIFILLFVQ